MRKITCNTFFSEILIIIKCNAYNRIKNVIVQLTQNIYKLTSGKEEINLCILAFVAASIISVMGTTRLLSPYAIFSAIVLSNSTGSCDTIPSCNLSECKVTDDTSRPSIFCKHKMQNLSNSTPSLCRSLWCPVVWLLCHPTTIIYLTSSPICIINIFHFCYCACMAYITAETNQKYLFINFIQNFNQHFLSTYINKIIRHHQYELWHTR